MFVDFFVPVCTWQMHAYIMHAYQHNILFIRNKATKKKNNVSIKM